MAWTVRDVTALLEGTYHPSWAEDWDAVGLVCGDPHAAVAKVLLAVDPHPGVVAEARSWGADLLVCHHPLLLKPVHSVAADSPKGRAVHELVSASCALFTAHTNADSPAFGVNEALARALGLQDVRVLVPAADQIDKLVSFVPRQEAETIRKAITDAGAGSIGDYAGCTFTTEGTGRFRPLAGSDPAIGQVGEPEQVAESRVEAVFPRHRRQRVIEAMRAVHPYQEPAFDVLELADIPGSGRRARGMGRIGRLAAPMSLQDFARSVRAALPQTAHGVRVGGDPERQVETVAVASGAGDFLLETVLSTDADVYLTSDLRHHRAGEFLEHAGPALVDVAHWAAEWTWLPVLEDKLRAELTAGHQVEDDVEYDVEDDEVEIKVSTLCTDPWSFRL